MASLFDDHEPFRPVADRPFDTTPLTTAGRPAGPRRRGVAPALTGLLVTLAVAGGIAFGHAAWQSTPLVAAVGQNGSLAPSPSGSGAYFGGAGSGNGAGAGSGRSGSTGTSAPAGVAAIAAKVNPALVNITSTLGYQGAEGAGTGIVLSADGQILTNNHVVAGASSISVTDVGNGQTYKGTVVGYDTSRDIAVVQLRNASGLQTAKLGDSSTVKVGQMVVAIGNAGGTGSTPSTAAGSVTALGRSITAGNELDGSSEQLSGLIQVDANVQPGDSGGSLVNTAGEVIGVDTAASAGFSFQQAAGGEGFAIPINQAVSIAKQITSGQGSATVHIGPTALLGVLGSSSPTRGGYGYGDNGITGAQVDAVADGSAAQQVGLVGGDVITSLNGSAVDSSATLSGLMISLKPGDNVALKWVDAYGQSHSTTVTLGTGPPA